MRQRSGGGEGKTGLERPGGASYNRVMNEFGKGPPLIETCPYLRDAAERIERILDVTERNSVIEGLPPFGPESRERMRSELAAIAAGRQSRPSE